jgi:hypothetical protein
MEDSLITLKEMEGGLIVVNSVPSTISLFFVLYEISRYQNISEFHFGVLYINTYIKKST